MKTECRHKNTELTVKDIADIFSKNYRTILNWLKQEHTVVSKGNLVYNRGKFPNAYKCSKCNQIYIPVTDVDDLLNKMEERS